MSGYVSRAAQTRMRQTYQPGPYKGKYRTETKSEEMKGRQFGPGPRPGVGPSYGKLVNAHPR